MSNRDIESVLVDLGAGVPVRDWEPQQDDELAVSLHRFLVEASNGPSVYDTPAAFEAFIDGAGNVALYHRTIALLASRLERSGPVSLADFGCGDGRVTFGSLPATARVVDLIEPSPALLVQAARQPWLPAVDVRLHEADIELFLATTTGRWDVALSTFALHNLPHDQRRTVLRELAERTGELFVVEFDVPAYTDRSAAHAAYVVDRYRRGVHEYTGNDLVILGFLMPVLTGQFDPARPRVTWEQPIERWVDDFVTAGFTTVTTEAVQDYWWAPASLIHALPAG